jgi:hypothetical protein
VVVQAIRESKVALNRIRGVTAFNQAQWIHMLWCRALRTTGRFSIPGPEQWPVPDFESEPLVNLPMPFVIGEDRMLYEYPNPLKGVDQAALGTGFAISERTASVRNTSARNSPAPSHPNITVRRSTRVTVRGRRGIDATATAPPAYSQVPAGPSASSSAIPSAASGSHTGPQYWVVVRGVIPGLYDNLHQVRHAVCRCSNALVRDFRNIGEASAFHAQVQNTGSGEALMCTCDL